jgi:hypothetical protein
MGFQPFPVLEKGAKQQSDLSMLIASGPGGNKRAYRKLYASLIAFPSTRPR